MNRILSIVLFGACFLPVLDAQNLVCNSTAVPPLVRGEGVTERVGDIVLNCSGGAPSARVTGNFTVFLNTAITNRISATNTVPDVQLTVDIGSGPQPANVAGTLAGGNLVFNGLSFTLSTSGTAAIRLANVRTAAIQLMLLPDALIQAYLAFNGGTFISLTNSVLTVGVVERGLYSSASSKLVCAPGGSILPANTQSYTQLLTGGVAYATTRITEGFADALSPKAAWPNLNADSGERVVVRYTGFPAGARLFVPDVVAGSDALQPTGAGDYGVPASGGQYARSVSGSLLLARVANADQYGAGGSPVYVPGGQGSAAVTFDGVSEIPVVDGNAVAVYEVVDANPNLLETAQFPTFLGLAPSVVNTPVVTGEAVTFGAISTTNQPSTSAAIPRFSPQVAPADCSIVGDCSANYFPRLYVDTTPLTYTAQAGGSYQVAYARVLNQGGGVLNWNTAVNYQGPTGWLRIDPASGTNNATIRIDALPGTLPPGTYQATVNVSSYPAGSMNIPVTLSIIAAPPPQIQPPAIQSIVNAASFAAGPVAPGSLATIQGVKLSGKTVSVTFDGVPAQILFSNDNQVNLLVPATLSGKTSAQVIVTADGNASAPITANLAPFAPAIFSGAVLNQDNSLNGQANPSALGGIIQVFATGLSGQGTITAQIHDRIIDMPYYAGPAPGFVGVQQIDLVVPQDLPAMTTDVYVCGTAPGGQKVCSTPARVTIGP